MDCYNCLMLPFIVLALLQLASAAEIKAWGQCGGISCEGGPCADAPWKQSACPAGSACTRKTQFYWQCTPSATMFGQCGGKSCKMGGLCADDIWAACPKGSACVRQSEFYWQCKEDATAVKAKLEPQTIVTISSMPSSSTAAKTTDAPAKSSSTAAATTDAPAKSSSTAAETTDAPVKSSSTAAETTDAPAKDSSAAAEATDAHAKRRAARKHVKSLQPQDSATTVTPAAQP